MRGLFLFLLLCFAVFYAGAARANCTLAGSAVCNGVACPGKNFVAGSIIHNADFGVLQVCRSDGTWRALHGFSDACAVLLPAPGTLCADGTIFAGFHPVTNARIFVMAQDAPTTMAWNAGSTTNWHNLPAPMDDCPVLMPDPGVGARTPLGTAGCHDGQTYTAYLAAQTNPADMDAPYNAAKYCADLTPQTDAVRALGHDDWYLPSINELGLLFSNLGPAPGYNFQNANYRSSSEYNASRAWRQSFGAGGTQNVFDKNFLHSVRCIRQ